MIDRSSGNSKDKRSSRLSVCLNIGRIPHALRGRFRNVLDFVIDEGVVIGHFDEDASDCLAARVEHPDRHEDPRVVIADHDALTIHAPHEQRLNRGLLVLAQHAGGHLADRLWNATRPSGYAAVSADGKRTHRDRGGLLQPDEASIECLLDRSLSLQVDGAASVAHLTRHRTHPSSEGEHPSRGVERPAHCERSGSDEGDNGGGGHANHGLCPSEQRTLGRA